MSQISAVYLPGATPASLLGNPLAEALLPLPCDPAKLAMKLSRKPRVDFSKGIEDPTTYFEIAGLLDIHLPREQSKALAFRIRSMIFRSYERQHPFCKETVRRLNTLGDSHVDIERRHEEVLLDGLHVDAMLLLAWSGMGKSTMIRLALSLLPQVIVHRSFQGRSWFQKQIVFLSIDAPVSASPKGLLLSICRAIDVALGLEDDASILNTISTSASVESLRVHVVRALASHCVGLLHVDDMQRFDEGNKLMKQQAVALLISIANTCCCSLLFSGTQDALNVIENNMESVRRVLRRGSIQLKAPYSDDDPFFSKLVLSILKYQVHETRLEPSGNVIKLLLNMTAGIPGLVNSLLVATLEASFMSRKPLTEALIRAVFEDQFSLIKPCIKVLNTLRTQPEQGWNVRADTSVSKFMNDLSRKRG
jgi:hypothetical protein